MNPTLKKRISFWFFFIFVIYSFMINKREKKIRINKREMKNIYGFMFPLKYSYKLPIHFFIILNTFIILYFTRHLIYKEKPNHLLQKSKI